MDTTTASGSGPFAQMDADMLRNPQPTYQLMRDAGPAFSIDGVGVLVVDRSAVDELFRHPELFSSNMSAVDLSNLRPLIPLQIDPPDHRKYRRVLDPLFAPAQMAAIEPDVVRLVHQLIDRFVDRGECDFAVEFSVPLPSQVFLTMLGLPLSDLDVFLRMKDGIIRPDHVLGETPGSDAGKAYQKQIADSIYDYFNAVLDEREHQRRSDLLSRFLDAEVDGQPLRREEILDICFLFLIAGLDTVSASLDCFFGYLAQHPDMRRQLVEQPTRIPSAVEELLRWETPVTGVARVAAADTELGGCPIRAGEQVAVLLGAANTDPHEFPDNDQVRFDRNPNRHLAFGGGIHRCLGSHLARMELRTVLREWHTRIPEYHIKPGHVLQYTPAIRSLDTLPLVLDHPK